MPPAAISRSSTYFPKICGNIAPSQRSAFAAAWLAFALVGCGTRTEPATNTVQVGAHELPSCALPDRGSADPSPFRLTLTALGPFPSDGFEIETDIGLHDDGHPLAFNPATQGVDAVASDSPSDASRAYIGHSERRDSARIEVLLWPTARACSLIADGSSPYPGGAAGQALGFSASAGVALVAGENAADQRAGSALAFETDTGHASLVGRQQGALQASRSFATVTEFGDGLLVAGGTNPFDTAAGPLDTPGTAEVYEPSRGGFDPELIDLRFRRTHHAAVRLPTTGETLLVGGVAPGTASEGPGQVIRQAEAVSPDSKQSSITEVASLVIGRVDPTALVLSDGRLVVGGGYAPSQDASEPDGDPVGAVEWFSPDARENLFSTELPPRAHRSFAALPGGGVLSVASCRGEPEDERADCSCVTADGGACSDDPDQAWVDAWWLDPAGNAQPVAFAPGTVLATCPTPSRPLLVPGSDGAPWLVVSPDDGGPACLWRFEAWPEDTAGSESMPGDPLARAHFVTTPLVLEPAPDARVPLLATAPDAFLWVTAAGGLFGARLGHRGPLTRDDLSLLTRGEAPYRPPHLVPDRDPSLTGTGDARGAGTAPVSYDGRVLTLAPSNPSVTVWTADTLFGDVAATIDVAVPSDGSAPALPLLVLGSATDGASASCAWNAPASASDGGDAATGTSPLTLTATRRGTRVTLSAPGLAPETCEAPAGAVSLGLRAGDGAVTLERFTLERLLLE